MSTPPPARRIGRILSLGVPLPGTRVDNYNFLSAPSFFDYDALVVDLGALTHLVESVADGTLEPETFSHQRVCLTARSSDEVALPDLLMRRREETERLLSNGGVIVAFAQPPVELPGIDGMGEVSNYWWLPAAAGVRYGDHIVPADGTQAQIVDYQHPMAPAVLGQLANIAYRARVAIDDIPSFAAKGSVFVRSYGNAAIGVEVPSASGRIVFLPAIKAAPGGDARYAFSDTMQAGIRRMLGVMAEGRRPSWLAGHSLPGLDERMSALSAALGERDRAQKSVDQAQASLDALARYQALLWQEGALGLDPVVVDALKLIGFTAYDTNPDEIEIRHGDTSALVEIDTSDGAVGMAAHYRLRQRIERTIERRGAAPRGLLLINGHRLRPPSERPQQASDALVLAAETMRYCIAPTSALFAAVHAQLSGNDDEVASFREALLCSNGLMSSGRSP
jgi:hypothetical protein